MKNRSSRSAGFSLIEVLVAVALLAVILLALMGLISAGVQRAYSGKKMTEATVIAQAAMERANVYAAYTLLGAAKTDSTAEGKWTRKTGSTTPAALSGTTDEINEKNAWRDLLEKADLPASDSHPAELSVKMDARPDGRTFDTASMIRVVVEISWTEWGTRKRQVRLQTLNLKKTP